MLGAASTGFGAPIASINGTIVEDTMDMPFKRVANAKSAIYELYTG